MAHPDLYRYIHKTSLEPSGDIFPNDSELFWKNETEQVTGSFKARAGVNARLEYEDPIVIASAGNFSSGIALGCAITGRHADIFMSRLTPLSKVTSTEQAGGEHIAIHYAGESFSDALEAAQKYAAGQGKSFVSAYDDEAVIAGNQTLFDEVEQQTRDFETVVYSVPYGGGGLAGAACRAALVRPNTHVLVTQFASNTTAVRSLENGYATPVDEVDPACGGVAVAKSGELPVKDMLELNSQGRLHMTNVNRADVGAKIFQEDLRRSQLVADYGEKLAYELFPEPTGFIAEAGVEQFAETAAARALGRTCFVAIRTGANGDSAQEQKLVEAHLQATSSLATRSHVWNGAHTNFR